MDGQEKMKNLSRRNFLRSTGAVGSLLAWDALLPAWAHSAARGAGGPDISALSGTSFDLNIRAATILLDGKPGHAILVNNRLPAPLIRWREGTDVTLRVTNHLHEDTSIHWHGILLPFQMDGVPGISFPGIRPGETFTYRFTVRQAGTYWYHSHSGLQEQQGHYGPLIIEPRDPDPTPFDREHVMVLSDWTFEHPHRVFAKLKGMSDSYNFQQQTVPDFLRQTMAKGLERTLSERLAWGRMRMNRTDIADVTGATYTYLLNGHSPGENWTGLFTPGENVRLRVINASAMSIFNVRIPGLPMTVVQADGLNVQPVETDEFQIGTAETLDVIIQPEDRAYTLMAESNDRSGYARATLTPRLGLEAAVPPLRRRPMLTMKDMAMGPGAHDHSAMRGHAAGTAIGHRAQGVGVVGQAENPVNRLSERPLGLEDAPHRVLVYTDLKSLAPNPDPRAPGGEMELHLTSNMERYMWSFDGVKFSDATEPLRFRKGNGFGCSSSTIR